MSYALRPGLSFCAVEDRLLFLDLPADRYFCLSRDADHAFARLYRAQILSAADQSCLARMAESGLLVEGGQAARIAPCRAPAVATRSLIHGSAVSPGTADRTAALVHLSRAWLDLKIVGFARALARLSRRKEKTHPCPQPERIARVAAAFEGWKTVVSAHDRCLPHSLAVAHRLIDVGAPSELVLAVKLEPFRAHAWVQSGETLVNERTEVARLFTPILVL